MYKTYILYQHFTCSITVNRINVFGTKISLLCASENDFVSTFTKKIQKVTKCEIQCPFLDKIKWSNILSLCQCLVPNIRNKLMEHVWDTRAYLPLTPWAIPIPYNGYFLRLEIFAIWAQKHNILIFAFLIFAIPFNHKKWLIDHYFHTRIWFSSGVIELSWIVCLTSQLTIFQSYMWRHIDV